MGFIWYSIMEALTRTSPVGTLPVKQAINETITYNQSNPINQQPQFNLIDTSDAVGIIGVGIIAIAGAWAINKFL